MKKKLVPVLLLLLFALVVGACGGDDEEAEPPRVEYVEVEGEQIEVTRIVTEQVVEEAAAATPARDAAPPGNGVPGPQPVAAQIPGRMIIKEAQMEVLVESTDMAVNRVTDITVGAGGYILSQRVWDGEQGYRYATMTLGVPVENFERVLQQLRRLGQVVNEEASGDDVTEEYVDLDSRLESLETTHERLLSFLEEAEDVEEILALNERIAEVETELSQIQGRMNYLANRAAFSTINLSLNPNIPTPTPTPTLTPVPTPTPTRWTPGVTARQATDRLERTTQNLLTFLIYNVIVCGPWLLLAIPITYVALRLFRRVTGSPLHRVKTDEEQPEA